MRTVAAGVRGHCASRTRHGGGKDGKAREPAAIHGSNGRIGAHQGAGEPAARTPWELHSGRPLEWYTLSENLYRAYALTGSAKYKGFGDVWRCDGYRDKSAATSAPADAHGVHAYSHCNSFSGAAMACMIEGDPGLLERMKNFYDFLQASQCCATGGYGPAERFVLADGALGESLESRPDSSRNNYTCCSGTYFQKVAEYQNLIYFTDGEALYVNLYLPSTAAWERPGGVIRLILETRYPEAGAVSMRLEAPQPARFALRLRVPAWSGDLSPWINMGPVRADAKPGDWASVEREWRDGDRIDMTVPLRFRRVPIDRQHPNRVMPLHRFGEMATYRPYFDSELRHVLW